MHKILSSISIVALTSCGHQDNESDSSVQQTRTQRAIAEIQKQIASYNRSAAIKTNDSRWKCSGVFRTHTQPNCRINVNVSYGTFPQTEIVRALYYKKLQMVVDSNNLEYGNVTYIEFESSTGKKLVASHRTFVGDGIGWAYVHGAYKGKCFRLEYTGNDSFRCTELVKEKVEIAAPVATTPSTEEMNPVQRNLYQAQQNFLEILRGIIKPENHSSQRTRVIDAGCGKSWCQTTRTTSGPTFYRAVIRGGNIETFTF